MRFLEGNGQGIYFDWRIEAGTETLESGRKSFDGELPYDRNKREPFTFTTPAVLPQPVTEAELVVELHANGQSISENRYDILLADDEYVGVAEGLNVGLYSDSNAFDDVLSRLRVNVTTVGAGQRALVTETGSGTGTMYRGVLQGARASRARHRPGRGGPGGLCCFLLCNGGEGVFAETRARGASVRNSRVCGVSSAISWMSQIASRISRQIWSRTS